MAIPGVPPSERKEVCPTVGSYVSRTPPTSPKALAEIERRV
jgi:hypothetical protein